jgi:hypothetical protein
MVLGHDARGVSEFGKDLETGARETEAALSRLVAICIAAYGDRVGDVFRGRKLFSKERSRVFLDEYPGFEIEPERKTQELVRGPRVAVYTAVLASPVRVYTGVEADVGAVVVRD